MTSSIIIKSQLFECFDILVENTDKIIDVKKYIYKTKGIPIETQQLYIGGINIDNEKIINEYNIKNGDIIYLNYKLDL